MSAIPKQAMTKSYHDSHAQAGYDQVLSCQPCPSRLWPSPMMTAMPKQVMTKSYNDSHAQAGYGQVL
ncbi:hypothetical protein DPMN_040876 [Dreissena polymorpha]|uniref:Uncharacterized protein n=1 Tax=Dreissena polymorpha TaxID=45954 RepID=A0A9D4CYD6_DREPO|nr:hypothetical protein DPMN_040876 [Dreissena polymorpha]